MVAFVLQTMYVDMFQDFQYVLDVIYHNETAKKLSQFSQLSIGSDNGLPLVGANNRLV